MTIDFEIPDIIIKPKEKVVRTSLEGKVGSRVKRSEYVGNGHWDFPITMGKEPYVGFIYIIRNTVNNRCYIGKKFYKGSGKLNKGQDSNWPWYISSSKELAADVKAVGKEGFEFYCLDQYVARGALAYAETWSLCHVDSPLNRDKWYNTQIGEVSWKVNEPVTELHKERLDIIRSV